MYPENGFTKAAVIDYYIRVAPVVLPHLKGRPLTLKRYPDGVEGAFFYEKQCPVHRPDWVTTAVITSRGEKRKSIRYCLVESVEALVWVANLAGLELHPSLHLANQVDRPTILAFDLDPGEGTDVLDCAAIALRLRQALSHLGLDCLAKTSGSKGLQVYTPLNTAVTYAETKAFAHSMAKMQVELEPAKVVSRMTKALRRGKVLIDWSQNDQHKTTVGVYSLRAKERPTVSTPVHWEELEDALRKKQARRLVFEAGDVLRRVEREGDLFKPVLTLRQHLPKLE